MNRMNRRLLSTLLMTAGIVAPAVGNDGSPGDESPPPQFRSTAKVEVVNMNVLVTDRQGRPMTGLTAEEFELLVDGEAVALTNFLAPRDNTTDPDRSRENNAPVIAPEKPQYLAIFVDNRGGNPLARDEALRELGTQLPTFSPADAASCW